MDFLALIRNHGFADGELAGETGFNSTPKTRAVLIRARKPAPGEERREAPGEGGTGPMVLLPAAGPDTGT